MAGKQRRQIISLGAVSASSNSKKASLASHTKCIVYAEADATVGSRNVDVQWSPDGTTFFTETALQFSLTADEAAAIAIPTCAGIVRVAVSGTGGLAGAYVEAMREVG